MILDDPTLTDQVKTKIKDQQITAENAVDQVIAELITIFENMEDEKDLLSQTKDGHRPAILRLVKNVIDASHKAGKWTGMCGEMAGEPRAALILLGMGIDELSMSEFPSPG